MTEPFAELEEKRREADKRYMRKRERFEEWQIQPVEWRVRPAHPNGGSYVDPRIETEWIVWLAAWQASAPSTDKLAEAARKIADFDMQELPVDSPEFNRERRIAELLQILTDTLGEK